MKNIYKIFIKVLVLVLLVIVLIVVGYNFFIKKNDTPPADILAEFDRLYAEELLFDDNDYKEIQCPDVIDKVLYANQSKYDASTGTILTNDYKIYFYDTNKLNDSKNCVVVDSMGKTYNKMIGSDFISDDNLVTAYYNPTYKFSVGLLDKEDIRISILNKFSNSCMFASNTSGVLLGFACENKIYSIDDLKEPLFTLPKNERILYLGINLIKSNKNIYIRKTLNPDECSINFGVQCKYDYVKSDNLTKLFKYISFYSNAVIQDSNGRLFANTYNIE